MIHTTLPRRAAAALLTILLLLAGACAGGGSSDGAGEAGSGGPSGPREDATFASLSEGERVWMQAAIKQFIATDPAWPATRAEWLAKGEREANYLVDLMWGALLRSQKLAASDLVERARFELAFIGTPAVDLMGEILAGGTAFEFYDEIAEETKSVKVDDTARMEAAHVLTIVGEPAVPTLVWVLDNADTKSGRKFAVMALGDMGDKGGPAALSSLSNALDDADWVLRVEAVHALRTRTDAVSQSLLESALGDGESLVREKAADALAVRRQSSALPALRAAEQNARDNTRLAEAARYRRAIAILEKYGK